MVGHGVLVAVTERCCYRVTYIVGFRLRQAPSSALSARLRRRNRVRGYVHVVSDVQQPQVPLAMSTVDSTTETACDE
jgi:hypothetical protein